MKKSFTLLILGLMLIIKSFGNPIVPPPMITEIYFNAEGNWSNELCFWGVYEGTLDDFRLTGYTRIWKWLEIDFLPDRDFEVFFH